MPFQVIPRELAFFDLFDRAADNVEKGSAELVELVSDLANASRHAERIRDLEHAGDDLTHEVFSLLHRTFVTPFDRHDIHHLASSLDDILDGQEAVAELGGVAGNAEHRHAPRVKKRSERHHRGAWR